MVVSNELHTEDICGKVPEVVLDMLLVSVRRQLGANEDSAGTSKGDGGSQTSAVKGDVGSCYYRLSTGVVLLSSVLLLLGSIWI